LIALAEVKRAHSFKAVSVGTLPPLGILFFWLHAAVDREASALATVVALATSFLGGPETRLRALIRRRIEEAASQEWPLGV
jgi:hypothetical protein